jgi:hypothetical protein
MPRFYTRQPLFFAVFLLTGGRYSNPIAARQRISCVRSESGTPFVVSLVDVRFRPDIDRLVDIAGGRGSAIRDMAGRIAEPKLNTTILPKFR